MLPRSQRLTSAQFNRAFADSQSVRHPLVALKAHWRDDESAAVRAAFVVPKKQAKAVGRNRARRRLRERYRLHPRRAELRGCDLIFLSTPATHDATGAQLDDALDEVLRRMKRKLGAQRGEQKPKLEKSQESSSSTERHPKRVGPAPTESSANPVINQAIAENQTGELAPYAESESGVPISIFAAAALSVIRFYQRFVSPGLPPSCRFYPSCSRYTYGAIERFGLARGLWLGFYRLSRCHPWHAGGIDEVPDRFPPLSTVKARSIDKIKAFFARRRFDSPRN